MPECATKFNSDIGCASLNLEPERIIIIVLALKIAQQQSKVRNGGMVHVCCVVEKWKRKYHFHGQVYF